MQDTDIIEIGFVFSDSLSFEQTDELVKELPSVSGDICEDEDYKLTYWDEDGKKRTHGNEKETSTIFMDSQICTVKVRAEHFKLTISQNLREGLLSSVPHLYFRIRRIWLLSSDENKTDLEKPRRQFVETLATMAEVLEPTWGFGSKGGIAIGENETVAELADSITPPLYEYNVFRSETVDAIGRERILNSPAWYVTELNTGGIFLAVGEPPMQYQGFIDERRSVAEHLGLDTAKMEKYHPS